ncbi:MAG: hypothetical protein PHF86_02340 [Candidatus Nanoarchaeia archaeon]|nr:hypothetical protein [Candidatus Nanoarchaeia archaeon]
MKAIIIKEVLNFERGKDPKKSMDIGFFIKRDFNNSNEAIEWIYNHLSAILKTDKIPEDIIMGRERKIAHGKTYLFFKEKYLYKIGDYIDEYLTINNKKIDWIELLWKKLSNSGFKTLLKLDESIHFNREGSAFNKMNIGKKYSDEEFIEKINWHYSLGNAESENLEIFKIIRNYKDFPILVLYNPLKNFYMATSISESTDYYFTAEEAIKKIKILIDQSKRPKLSFDESIEVMDLLEDLFKYSKKINNIKLQNLIRSKGKYKSYKRLTEKQLKELNKIRLNSSDYELKELINKLLNLEKMINESFNFDREGSNLDKFKIGKKYSDEKFIEETDWVFSIKYIYEKFNIIELIRDYKGFPILILELKDAYLNKSKNTVISTKYTAISSKDLLDGYFYESTTALEEMQEIIDNKIKNKI